MQRDLFGFVGGLVLSTSTSPVGVSGEVFLLPVRLSGPGALLRYGRRGQLGGTLVRSLAWCPGRCWHPLGVVILLSTRGSGSILGPILVGSGMAVSAVAPAARASTFVTSIVGVATFAGLRLNTSGSIGPDWSLGVACGLGGLCGGYVGASLQPRLPETTLRVLLGVLAIGLALLYAVQAV